MMGYLFNEDKTAETFDADGWLKSGDIASIDADGFVSITGRIKELIITAGGENIPPVLIEDTIKSELPCVSNAIVIGDRRKFLSCILTLKVDVDADTMVPQKILAPNTLAWLASIGVSNVQTVDEAMKTPAIGEAIQKGIDRANARYIVNEMGSFHELNFYHIHILTPEPLPTPRGSSSGSCCRWTSACPAASSAPRSR